MLASKYKCQRLVLRNAETQYLPIFFSQISCRKHSRIMTWTAVNINSLFTAPLFFKKIGNVGTGQTTSGYITQPSKNSLFRTFVTLIEQLITSHMFTKPRDTSDSPANKQEICFEDSCKLKCLTDGHRSIRLTKYCSLITNTLIPCTTAFFMSIRLL